MGELSKMFTMADSIVVEQEEAKVGARMRSFDLDAFIRAYFSVPSSVLREMCAAWCMRVAQSLPMSCSLTGCK